MPLFYLRPFSFHEKPRKHSLLKQINLDVLVLFVALVLFTILIVLPAIMTFSAS